MKFLLMLFFLPLLAIGDTEVEEAKQSIKALIQPLIGQNSTKRPKGTEKFSVEGCDKKKINWMNVLLMRETATLDFKFKKNCDIQGSITPRVIKPFPVNLDLRDLQSYSRVESTNTITADFQNKPILNLEMREGTLSGKHKVIFEADYKVQINPIAKNPVEKNLGGELRILEINGKKTNIKEKIMVK
jgi:hypothetical protein